MRKGLYDRSHLYEYVYVYVAKYWLFGIFLKKKKKKIGKVVMGLSFVLRDRESDGWLPVHLRSSATSISLLTHDVCPLGVVGTREFDWCACREVRLFYIYVAAETARAISRHCLQCGTPLIAVQCITLKVHAQCAQSVFFETLVIIVILFCFLSPLFLSSSLSCLRCWLVLKAW